MRPSLLRRPASESTLQIIEVEPPMRVTWYMTAERLDVELRLEDAGNHHTNVELTVTGPFMVGLRRSLPQNGAQPPLRPVPDCRRALRCSTSATTSPRWRPSSSR